MRTHDILKGKISPNNLDTTWSPGRATLKIQAAGSSKTLVPIYQTVSHHMPEDALFIVIAMRIPVSYNYLIGTKYLVQ
jgi:hypothetical protein